MSRMTSGETVVVKPANNIYTALSGVALVIVILGLAMLWMKATDLHGGLFTEAPANVR